MRATWFLAACGLATAALAAPIPIDGPVVITESGDYVVTQDFSGNPAIKLLGRITVSIDFAGHAISGLIDVQDMYEPNDCPRLSILNGAFSGSIESWGQGRHCFGYVSADMMTLSGGRISAEDGSLTVTSSVLYGMTLLADANFAGGVPTIIGNAIFAGEILGWGAIGGRITDNIIDDGFIELSSSDGFFSDSTLVSGNLMKHGIIKLGDGHDGARAIQVLRNEIDGIDMRNTRDSILDGNTIRRCARSDSAVYLYFSRRNRIDNNQFQDCEHGIWFDDLSSQNTYSNNTFPEPPPDEPIVDYGTGNRELNPDYPVKFDPVLELGIRKSNGTKPALKPGLEIKWFSWHAPCNSPPPVGVRGGL